MKIILGIISAAILLAFSLAFIALKARERCAPTKSDIANSTEIIKIDNCEYLLYYNGVDVSSISLTHKGNCSNPIHSK